MIRTIARFEDRHTALAAIRSAISASFPPENIHLHAIRPDGSRVAVPVGFRSHFIHGLVIGTLLLAPVGVYLGLAYHIPVTSGAIGAGGIGAIVGSTVGLGSWSAAPPSRLIPSDATGFVVAIDAPEGRAPAVRELLQRAGGLDASPQPV